LAISTKAAARSFGARASRLGQLLVGVRQLVAGAVHLDFYPVSFGRVGHIGLGLGAAAGLFSGGYAVKAKGH
jgi:hypothetical protein